MWLIDLVEIQSAIEGDIDGQRTPGQREHCADTLRPVQPDGDNLMQVASPHNEVRFVLRHAQRELPIKGQCESWRNPLQRFSAEIEDV